MSLLSSFTVWKAWRLLRAMSLLIMYFSPERLMAFLLLVVVLVVKMDLEERLFCERFAAYREYMRKTARLFPYIY